ncbi:MAG: shikimate dehydrogenase [Omnitrophica WOR_2 bacterium RIFCSPLOWO2_12_FULL_51_24]|nr:MAG: shikimate dehydrogenase [Omnitrophica WOR_2 bacterium RIFCSPHIGHO2_01_FULL_49_10]OGX34437.1 MAG: shikimate dehydrogenase [Omnitrophica WOR_2 bacterium RIFCSPLOWO2_02_FULL_50_19]OGX42167.1 MAG: shikimate dehydrogenase [Omnitrophica WOR_2 bacterium RIFCSPLOWO2_12_FULL_51_24]
MRSKKIGGSSRIFGIIGFPVKHTLSPHFQNAAFASLGMDALYVPFEVASRDLKAAVRGLKALGISGVNVTIPHKQAVLPLVDELSAEAKGIGAANTIVFSRNGKAKAYNTDGEGFIRSLKGELKINPKGRSVLLFGCGGAAKAIAFVLAREGVRSISFVDQAEKRAKELAAKIKKDFPRCGTKHIPFLRSRIDEEALDSDLLVNASPVGMHKGDPCIINPKALHKDLAVYDIVYNPQATPLLKEAKKRGIRASNGLGMLLYQGVLSFELFTGRKAPVSVMRAALKKAIT